MIIVLYGKSDGTLRLATQEEIDLYDNTKQVRREFERKNEETLFYNFIYFIF
jgi:hypothetical protein